MQKPILQLQSGWICLPGQNLFLFRNACYPALKEVKIIIEISFSTAKLNNFSLFPNFCKKFFLFRNFCSFVENYKRWY